MALTKEKFFNAVRKIEELRETYNIPQELIDNLFEGVRFDLEVINKASVTNLNKSVTEVLNWEQNPPNGISEIFERLLEFEPDGITTGFKIDVKGLTNIWEDRAKREQVKILVKLYEAYKNKQQQQ